MVASPQPSIARDRSNASAFAAWLRIRVTVDGRSLSALNRAAAVGKVTINRILESPDWRPMERTVRKLAVFFGDDPDEIAVLAGYADLKAEVPDPVGFSTIRDWLAAALEARKESRWRAAKAAGLSELVVDQILDGRQPDHSTVNRLATYFGVDRADLLGLRGYRRQGQHAHQPTPSAFTSMLARQVYSAGVHPDAVARAAGVGANTLRRVLWRPGWRMREDQVRRLAAYFGESPDEWAALAGYADMRVTIPQPRQCGTLRDWLEAALSARNEGPVHASNGAGLAPSTIGRLIAGGGAVRATLDKLAAYFGQDRAEVRALRGKNARRVAAGKAIAAKIGQERMRERIAEVGKNRKQQTPEQRREYARMGGLTAARVVPLEQQQARAGAMLAARRARQQVTGSWFASEGARDRAVEKMRAAGLRRWADPAELERYGREHFARMALLAAEANRNGTDKLCVFCRDESRPIYVVPSRDRAGRGRYHRECYRAWRRSAAMREKSRAFGSLGQIRRRVLAADDLGLLREVDDQIAAVLRHLRNPSKADRPPVLLENRPLAIEMARLQHEGGLSAGEVAVLAGLPVTGPRAKPEAGKATYRLLRLGRALMGKERLPPGPRRFA